MMNKEEREVLIKTFYKGDYKAFFYDYVVKVLKALTEDSTIDYKAFFELINVISNDIEEMKKNG